MIDVNFNKNVNTTKLFLIVLLFGLKNFQTTDLNPGILSS